MPKAPSKKNGLVGTKRKGAMEMAKAVAEKVKRIPEKHKGKNLGNRSRMTSYTKIMNSKRLRRRVGRIRVRRVIGRVKFLLIRKYKRWKIGLRSKTKIRSWIPLTNKRNSSE